MSINVDGSDKVTLVDNFFIGKTVATFDMGRMREALNSIVAESGVKDVYIDSQPVAYISSQRVIVKDTYVEDLVLPDVVYDDVAIIDQVVAAAAAYVNSVLSPEFEYPLNYVLVLREALVTVSRQDIPDSVRLTAALVKVDTQPWPE